jgi:hypothetical protein
MLAARNQMKVKETKAKVSTVPMGASSPFGRRFSFRERHRRVSISLLTPTPCSDPHTTNVQAAPCQRPLMVKVTMTAKMTAGIPQSRSETARGL